MSDVFRGRVKWFNNTKGYGFITREDGNELFFHHTAIQMDGYRTLDEDTEVEFEVEEGPKGPSAIQVRAI